MISCKHCEKKFINRIVLDLHIADKHQDGKEVVVVWESFSL